MVAPEVSSPGETERGRSNVTYPVWHCLLLCCTAAPAAAYRGHVTSNWPRGSDSSHTRTSSMHRQWQIHTTHWKHYLSTILLVTGKYESSHKKFLCCIAAPAAAYIDHVTSNWPRGSQIVVTWGPPPCTDSDRYTQLTENIIFPQLFVTGKYESSHKKFLCCIAAPAAAYIDHVTSNWPRGSQIVVT